MANFIKDFWLGNFSSNFISNEFEHEDISPKHAPCA